MRLLLAVLLLMAVPLRGGELECGTSPEHVRWVRELGAWSALRAEAVSSKGLTSAATRRGEIFEIPADATNAPFRRPFDLEGRTLVFRPAGESAFSVSNTPIDWNEDRGTRAAVANGESGHAVVTLGFDFPFFDRRVRTLYVAPNNGIFLDPPSATDLRQYGALELAGESQAVIAPLLTTRSSRLTPLPEVYVRKDAGSASVTWTSPDRYTVRATLFPSGEIRFAYQKVTTTPAAGSVLLTSGREEWRSRRNELAARTDPAGDVRQAVPAPMTGMLDITKVAVERTGNLDLYAVRITTGAAVTMSAIPASESIQFQARMGQETIRLQLYGDGRQRYTLPGWGPSSVGNSVRFEGNDIVMTFLREHSGYFSAVPLVVWAYRNSTVIDTSDTIDIALPLDGGSVRTDFSETGETVIDGAPIAEAFTTPVLSVYRVWEQVKQSNPALTDAEVDAVAIYQNFYTDIVTYAGAYSTGGNPQVSGLWAGDQSSPNEKRSPALMHMNTIGYGHNRTLPGASRVALHELGHRWLLFVSLMENGQRSDILNPRSAHPAQWVDTRAAFKVYTDKDTSVMGGGFFADHNDGTFTSGPYGPYGYSWLDLYLMGLAGPDEVPPMFYIASSNPALGGEYYAPPDQTYSGIRRDFRVQQVIEGTGTRRPAFPSTQRSFRVVFVLVSDPGRPVADGEIAALNEYRAVLEQDFRVATNARGAISTAVETAPAGPRRRAAGK